MNDACAELMREEGIDAKICFVSDRYPLSHCDGNFEVAGKYYYFNLAVDLMKIQTGMKTRNFGISQNRIFKKLKNKSKNSEEDLTDHLAKMNKQNNGEQFSEITEETLKEWDDEFGFTYKGLYTNEVLELLAKESKDKKFMEEFFGTSIPDELTQRKFEFVMKYIGIINAVQGKTIRNEEAKDYFIKLIKSIITDEEKGKYIEICPGFIEENKRRRNASIVVIKKQAENIWYLYNPETQIYEQVKKGRLISKGIQYHESNDVVKPIYFYINEKEKELSERKSEEIDL